MYKVQKKYIPILAGIDIIGSVLFFWKKLIPFKIKRINKILIIRLDHIGDVLLTTPVIRALKQKMPSSKIDVLIRPFTKELLNTNPHVNKIHTLNPPWFNRETASFTNLIKFIFTNLQKYDLVVELHADPRNILLGSLVGKKVIGYNIRGLGFLLDKIANYEEHTNIIDRNLNVVRVLGCDSSSNIDIFLEKKDLNFAEDVFQIHNITNAVCITPGTGRINKFWLNDRWAALADHLIKKYNSKIIFLGSKEDKEIIIDITRQMKNNNYLDLSGGTTLRESAAIIQKSGLLVSPDTGSMHMAKSFDTPLVALFGPVNPKIWGYNDTKSRSIHVNLECSFCDLPKCPLKNKKNACMDLITVENVIKTIYEL